MKISEHALQSQCVEWFRWKYKDSIIAAFPNGARTSLGVAVRLKREGLLKGMPDLIIPEPSGQYHGLFIEMKVPGGKLQPHQKEMALKLSDRGYHVEMCDGFEAFQGAVEKYLSKVKILKT